MGRETSAERRRRSRSRSHSGDRYGRDKNDDRHKIYPNSRDRERGRQQDGSRRLHDEERDGWRRDRERDPSYEEPERGRGRGRDDRDRERSKERRDHRVENRRIDSEGHSGQIRSSATEKRPSRWGNAAPSVIVGNSANSFGGMYGPADNGRPSGGGRSGGGGGRGQAAPRDESWVEHRLKLRAEARPPRGVWNGSPSPPKKKEPKLTKSPALEITTKKQTKGRGGRSSNSKVSRRASSAKVVHNKDAKRKLRRKRASSSSSSSSGSSSSSSDSDSSSGGDSGSNGGNVSDSSSGGSSSSTNDTTKTERSKRLTRGKRKRRVVVGGTEEYDKLKGTRPASPLSPPEQVAQIDAAAIHDVKKASDGIPPEGLDDLDAAEAAQFKADVQGHRHHEAKDSDDEGPMPVPQLDDLQGEGERGVNYGGALLPGEGAAIAQFVQKGLRIPRRGEVGWAGQEIERLEDSGYVMSGSRHARMNAVRLRKENQVFNAEERRALALIMFEEKQQKENEILGNFRQMLTESTREGEKPAGESANAS